MTENTAAIYAQNYRAAQYDGRIAEKRRREALIALQEAQRRGEGREITERLTEYSAAVQAGVKALAVIHAAFVAGVTARVVRICDKCGWVKTLNARGQYRCRPCSRAIAAHGCAAAAAAKIARREAAEAAPESVPEPIAPAPVKVALPNYAVGSVPLMNPNAGRLKAGESLYPTKRIVAI